MPSVNRNPFRFLLTCLLRGMTAFYVCCIQHRGFLLTCLLRGMTCDNVSRETLFKFLLTCLLRGMTFTFCLYHCLGCVSTHMPLARHDIAKTHLHAPRAFLLTCLLRGMTVYTHTTRERHKFLLTCLLRGMTMTRE